MSANKKTGGIGRPLNSLTLLATSFSRNTLRIAQFREAAQSRQFDENEIAPRRSDSGIPHQSIDSRAVSRSIATAISDSTTHAAT